MSLSTHKFCPTCGAQLKSAPNEGQTNSPCSGCGRIIYYDPKVAATTVIGYNNQVLLVKRGNEPGYGLWSLPGGYVDRGEIVEEAAAREVFEETGLNINITRLIGVFSQKDHPVIVIAFSGEQISGELQTSDETLAVEFFDIDVLPEMAFPRDQEIIKSWLGTA